jgi:hypothetical protein
LEEGRRPSLATALPPSLLRDHLMPWLTVVEAARLRGACKALHGLVRDCPMHLGEVRKDAFEPALTCFPATESLTLWFDGQLAPAEEGRMGEVLGAHDGTLKRVLTNAEGGEQLLTSALRSGALPKLTHISLRLVNPVHQQVLSLRMLGLLECVKVTLDRGELAPLENLRRLPHLRSLELCCEEIPPLDAAFPPFLPPSLKTLTLDIRPLDTFEALLRDLPSTLQASGTRLEAIELWSPTNELSAASGAAIGRLLHLSSPTLKSLRLRDTSWRILGPSCLAALVPGLVTCCNTLEVLHCPGELFSALPPTCAGFPRLTELGIDGTARPIDLTTPAWGLLANGGLPALATLSFAIDHDSAEGEEEACPLVRAFEGVAGTLRRLTVEGLWWPDPPVGDGACYKLGTAIGKLRRLRYLHLSVSDDGRAYCAVGRGLAASGGCPELFELRVGSLARDMDFLTYEPSLILPSVRYLQIRGACSDNDLLLLCCGLVHMGYKHGLAELRGAGDYPLSVPLSACLRAILQR